MNLARIGQLLGLAALLAGAAMLMSAGSAFAECSNEQLRVESRSTGLPDCRGYELVTPAFKNGEPPTFANSYINEDGSALTFSSLGAFAGAGTDATVEGGEYRAQRGPGGWTTAALNPSAAVYQEGTPLPRPVISREVLDLTPALTETLLLKAPIAAKPIDARFYVQDLADAATTERGHVIAPETVAQWTPQVAESGNFPGTEYVGASSDLKEILFRQEAREGESPSWLWPGDETIFGSPGPPSIYVYHAAGESEPELLGVTNTTSVSAAARREGKQHVNQAADQITQCGVVLGGANPASPSPNDEYNAISRSGENVAFTALPKCIKPGTSEDAAGPPVQEVYVRRNGDETVAISEPPQGETGTCERCDESEPKAAIFQGASENGDVVYFISEQHYFDGAHGETETGYSLYSFALDGPPHDKLTTVATDLAMGPDEEVGGVLRISETGAYVYFASNAVLASNANDNGERAVAGGGESPTTNVYVYDAATDTTSFIALLSATQDSYEWQRDDSGRHVEATQDGHVLLFSSVNPITNDDHGNSMRQLFRYEIPSANHPSGLLLRVSVGASGDYNCSATLQSESGYNCDGKEASALQASLEPKYTHEAEPIYENQYTGTPARPTALADNGEKIFFASPDALTPGASDDVCVALVVESAECRIAAENIYEWNDRQVYLVMSGSVDGANLFRNSSIKLIGADPTGANVFFTTATSLVAQDTDSQLDVYDAQENGGFSAPAAGSGCEGEGCQGAVVTPPVFGAPGSATFSGQGSLTAPVPVVKVKAKSLTRAQKLEKTLKGCERDKKKARRRACEATARKRYGPPHKAKSRGGKR
jgi:hypothetical protein